MFSKKYIAPTTLLIGIFPAARAQFTVAVLPVQQDAGVGYHDNYDSANNNYDWSTHLSAISQPGHAGGVNKDRSLVMFDLSGIPSGSTILHAQLDLIGMGPFGTGVVGEVGSMGENTSTLRRVTSAWVDDVVTWNTQPTNTLQNAVHLPQSTYAEQNYLNVDVTALVQDMVDDPGNSFGFILCLDDETPSRGIVFYGGEAANPDQRPALTVVYGQCDVASIVAPPPAPNGMDHLVLSPDIAVIGTHVTIAATATAQGPIDLTVLDATGRIAAILPAIQLPFSWEVPALPPGRYVITARDRSGLNLGSGFFTTVR